STETLRDRMQWPFAFAVAVAVVLVATGFRGWLALFAFFLGGLGGGSCVRQLLLATRRNGWRGLAGRTNGGMVVHLGVICIGVALAASTAYATDREFTLRPGDVREVAGHTVEYVGTSTDETPQRTRTRAQIRVDGGQIYTPSLSRFSGGSNVIGTPSVKTSLTQDVYLALLPADTTGGDTIGLRVIVQPLVVWLWIGGILMFVGTALAAFPGRRRDPTDPVSAPVPSADATRPPAPEPEDRPELVGTSP
ncbi:MAG: heme lyase CcmF/NrfE family subunit, partial [Acidimicrobiia bacterium]|nr:heme lyase CcmF/NrfE family subunit [Acidimicrobiia bacterium]